MRILKEHLRKEDLLHMVQSNIEQKIAETEKNISPQDQEEDIEQKERTIRSLQEDLSSLRQLIKEHKGEIALGTLLNKNEAKSNEHSASLIDGVFRKEDALEVLMTAYRGKINFHQLKSWSKFERGEYGGDLHVARALELEMESDKIKGVIMTEAGENDLVRIVCKVALNVISEGQQNVQPKDTLYSH